MEIIIIFVTLFLGGIIIGFYAVKKSKSQLNIEFPKEISPEWKNEIIKSPTIKHPTDIHKIVCYDPSTGYILGNVDAVSAKEMREIVQSAKIAQKKYMTTTFQQRKELLKTILAWVVENQDKICRMTCRDSGKTIIDASFGEILTTCEKLRWTIANGESVLASEYRSPGMIMAHKVPRVEYHPVGVMGCIVSWNYPFHNVMGPVISALMAGNASVIKCSENVAWSTKFWESVFHAALDFHGLDRNLVRLVNGWADAGEALVETADKITFIGSPQVGKMVMKHASNTLTPVILELGGKDVAIIFDDADYDQIINVSLRGTFQNAGQNCAGLERLVVQDGIYDKFIADVQTRISQLRVGPPISDDQYDMGSMTMFTQMAKVQELVDDAVEKGARLLAGGKRFIHPDFPNGQYYLPTLLVDVKTEMKIAQEEVFGPVMCVMKFSNEDDAIRLANSSQYALGSSIFTLDYERGERVAKQLRAGMCNVNDFGSNYLCQGLPFGGIGISGIDRFAGVEGLRGQCNIRSATTDKYRAFGVRTNLPPLIRFPLTKKSQQFQEALIGTLYGSTWSEMGINLVNLLKVCFS